MANSADYPEQLVVQRAVAMERRRVLELIDARTAMFREQQKRLHRSPRIAPLGLLETLRREVERGG